MQRLLETKRAFVRFVSHEIRTPLNVMTMGLKLLQDQYVHYKKMSNTSKFQPKYVKLPLPIPAPVQGFESVIDAELIGDMLHSGDVAVNILNDLLLYEKIEGNLLNMEIEEVFMPLVIQDVAKIFKIQVR